jgi:hypothetical protein
MSSNNKAAKPDIPPNEKSNYRIVKEGGWDNMEHMMLSYGLKLYNDDDIQEAKQIIEKFREYDQQVYDARKQEQEGGKS